MPLEINGKVGNMEIRSVVGRWGVEGINENGQWLVDVCTARGLFLANTFQHKMNLLTAWLYHTLLSIYAHPLSIQTP